MGNEWMRTLSTTPIDFDFRGSSAIAGLHPVEQYPGIDISLLWDSEDTWRQQQDLEQKQQLNQKQQQEMHPAPGWLVLRTILLIATGAAWSRLLAENESWITVLQNEVSRMLAMRLSADVGSADEQI